ncbi:MAG: hypothetical protein K2L95_03495 [Alphaproteobacteria bacterium]|nr:hypothetical protein [Alphaproteobacteria bacterium]
MRVCAKADVKCSCYRDGICIAPNSKPCSYSQHVVSESGGFSRETELVLKYMTQILKNQEEILRQLHERQK